MTCLWPAVINTHRFPLLCGVVQGWVGWGTTRGGQVGLSFQTDLRKYNVQREAGGGEALRQRPRAGGGEVGKPQPAVQRPRDLQTSHTWASAPSAQGCAPRGTPASQAARHHPGSTLGASHLRPHPLTHLLSQTCRPDAVPPPGMLGPLGLGYSQSTHSLLPPPLLPV